MTLRTITTAALLLCTFEASAAQEMGLMVAMEVERDGQTLSRPSIWQPSGTAGEISMKNELRLTVTPTLAESKADVSVQIFTTQNGVESKVGSPRIITKMGEWASMAWGTASGHSYKLSLRVTESERPAR